MTFIIKKGKTMKSILALILSLVGFALLAGGAINGNFLGFFAGLIILLGAYDMLAPEKK